MTLIFIASRLATPDEGDPPATFDFYISPTGSDSNDGLTTSTPWAITALNTKRSTYTGKTVGLMDGTYNMYATLNDGSHNDVDIWALDVEGGSIGAPTVIKAVNARQAHITGKSGSAYGNAASASGPTPMFGHSGTTTHRGYVTFDALKITGVAREGIRVGIKSSTPQIAGITITNCDLTDFDGRTGPAGINYSQVELNSCTGYWIKNNYFHDNIGEVLNSSGHFSAILTWNCDRGIIESNTLVNSGGVYGKVDGQFGNAIRYNHIDCSALTADVATAIQDFSGYIGSSSTTTSIHHNVLVAGQCIQLIDSLDDAQYSRDLVEIYNNTCDALSGAATRGIRIKATAGNGSIYNNIVRDAATGDHAGPAYNVNIDGVADYNCYYSSAGDLKLSSYASVSATSRDTVSTLAAFRTATGAEAGSISADPNFVGTGAGAAKYQLNGGSPCAGAGRSNGLSSGSACDMGAFGNSAPATLGCDFA